MRLWSLHPKYLDSKGLVALWREGLLAQSVLFGKTGRYKNHPQLTRFRNTRQPSRFLSTFLFHIFQEARARGYDFKRSKIRSPKTSRKLSVTTGQIKYEWKWLLRKLQKRDRKRYAEIRSAKRIEIHPLFRRKQGPVEGWEKISSRLI